MRWLSWFLLTKPCSPKLNLNLAHARGFIPKKTFCHIYFSSSVLLLCYLSAAVFFLPLSLSLSRSLVFRSVVCLFQHSHTSSHYFALYFYVSLSFARRHRRRSAQSNKMIRLAQMQLRLCKCVFKGETQGRQSQAFKLYAKKASKLKKKKKRDVPTLTPDPSAEGKFIVPFLSFMHQRYFYIFHLYFTSFLSFKPYKELTLEMFFHHTPASHTHYGANADFRWCHYDGTKYPL